MIRIPNAAKLSAISSSKFLILLMRTPSFGTISYSVTVGPTTAEMLLMAMPKLSSVFSILILFSNSSFLMSSSVEAVKG